MIQTLGLKYHTLMNDFELVTFFLISTLNSRFIVSKCLLLVSTLISNGHLKLIIPKISLPDVPQKAASSTAFPTSAKKMALCLKNPAVHAQIN